MKIFQNKNCLIVGASGGIGSEIAKKLSEKNCNLFLIGKNRDKLLKIQKEIKKKNDSIKIEYESVDLTKLQEIKKVIKIIRKKFGKIDILINTAGLFLIKSVDSTSTEDFDEFFQINVKVPFIFCKEFARDMKKKKWGRIVNVGSSSSYNGFKNGTVYCSTKHALLGLSRALNKELKDKGVRTYCISPGSVKTKMGKLSKEQNFETFIEPKDIAEYVIFVISFDKESISEEIRINRIKIE